MKRSPHQKWHDMKAQSVLCSRTVCPARSFVVAVLVAAVPVMVEQVHQGARGEKQEGKNSEQVRAVFGDQKIRGDGQETEKDESRHGAQPIVRVTVLVFVLHVSAPWSGRVTRGPAWPAAGRF
jgi:hypothetical protein